MRKPLKIKLQINPQTLAYKEIWLFLQSHLFFLLRRQKNNKIHWRYFVQSTWHLPSQLYHTKLVESSKAVPLTAAASSMSAIVSQRSTANLSSSCLTATLFSLSRKPAMLSLSPLFLKTVSNRRVCAVNTNECSLLTESEMKTGGNLRKDSLKYTFIYIHVFPYIRVCVCDYIKQFYMYSIYIHILTYTYTYSIHIPIYILYV